MEPLLKVGLLEKTAQEDTESIFNLNFGFSNSKVKIYLNRPLKIEVVREDAKVATSVMTERRFQIQAAIVRIMKTRKTMKHGELVAEVISQLCQHFNPDVPSIKVRLVCLRFEFDLKI